MALAAALALSGCSDGAEQNASEQPETSAPSEAGENGGDAAVTEGAAVDTEVTGTVPEVDEPVATRTVRQDGNTYRLDVFPLVFDQGASAISVNVRLVFEEMAQSSVRPGLLASLEDQGSVRMRRATGLNVVDRQGGMAYLPARDAEGTPLCSPEVPIEAADGDQLYVTCVFGGLPEDVESLDLVVPNFGTFRDVPFE